MAAAIGADRTLEHEECICIKYCILTALYCAAVIPAGRAGHQRLWYRALEEGL